MRTCTVEKNKQNCNCSFGCGKCGVCCECLSYHRRRGELPGCYFPADIESGGNRSVANFINVIQQRGPGYLR
jgi:hypothetical protein